MYIAKLVLTSIVLNSCFGGELGACSQPIEKCNEDIIFAANQVELKLNQNIFD